jgi:hypothetical protein
MGFRPILEVPGKRQPQSWEEYRREVEKHARPGRGAPPVPLTAETKSPGNLVSPAPDEKRCAHHKKHAGGERCRNYAVKGATHCHKHGGLRQNPRHPAAARLLLSGALDAFERDENAWKEIRQNPARGAARSALLPYIRNPRADLVRDAINALALDDGGKAWRRLVTEVQSGARK